MPVKNTAQFLKECIDSIINQTETNWELIAVNDHSTDESVQLLEAYSKLDTRIKVYTNNGNGIINALRLAYTNSNGELITRMDSDDIMTPDKLSVLKVNLLKWGIGHLGIGLVKYFSENQLGDGFKKYESWLNELTKEGKNFEGIYKECTIPSPCWMVFKIDLELCEAFQPNRYPEDYDLAFRFYLQGLKPIPCTKTLHYWRDYSTRTSRTHIHYADNTFMDIKSHYFLKHEYDKNKNLVIWGAGNKGKTMAKILIANEIDFYWICDNPKKIGKHIYHQEMLPFTALTDIENTQSIITVANLNAQNEIRNYFKEHNYQPQKDYIFFC